MMNAGEIWWDQIGTSLQFTSAVTNALEDCRSAVLQIPAILPWRADFYEAIDIKRSAFGSDRRMMRLNWEDGAAPGEFVLDELCSGRVRADYWPGMTHAAYLGSRNDILLNDYYVWIKGIHSKSDIQKWVEFVAQYEAASSQLDKRAIFLLEYDGAKIDISGLEQIMYTVENYDCRVFSLEAAAALDNTDLRDYQAELALKICGSDPEFCFALLMAGQPLLNDPEETALQVISTARCADGRTFSDMTWQQIHSAAWEASLVLFFPMLERYRMDFISKNEAELFSHLPISNSNGDKVNDPYDLEIGSLGYIVKSAGRGFDPMDVGNIQLCSKARNCLAHNKIPPREYITKIITLS